MKLAAADYSVIFDFEQKHMYEWIIENQDEFRKIFSEMRKEESIFVFSNREKILKWNKAVEMIENPLLIDLSEKRIINKVYSELKEIAESEEAWMATQELYSVIHKFYIDLEEKTNFDIAVKDEPDFLQLTKAFGIQVEMNMDSFLELLSEYCRITFEMLDIQLLILVNLRSFLNDEEMRELGEMAARREWNILLLEGSERSIIDNVKRVILDKDRCEIF